MSSTKRTRPAESPAEQKPASAAPEKPARLPDLPQTHESIIDAVAELLTRGGHQRDVDALIRLSISHIERRVFEQAIGSYDQPKIEQLVAKVTQEYLQDWRTDLARSWKRKGKEETAIEPNTITERIRENVRESLRDRFDKFLGNASVEEQRLMLDVLISRDSCAYAGFVFWPDNALAIAEAFSYELSRDDRYLRVPESIQEQVQKYIDALLAIAEKAA